LLNTYTFYSLHVYALSIGKFSNLKKVYFEVKAEGLKMKIDIQLITRLLIYTYIINDNHDILDNYEFICYVYFNTYIEM
jgi:hypothetical protein